MADEINTDAAQEIVKQAYDLMDEVRGLVYDFANWDMEDPDTEAQRFPNITEEDAHHTGEAESALDRARRSPLPWTGLWPDPNAGEWVEYKACRLFEWYGEPKYVKRTMPSDSLTLTEGLSRAYHHLSLVEAYDAPELLRKVRDAQNLVVRGLRELGLTPDDPVVAALAVSE